MKDKRGRELQVGDTVVTTAAHGYIELVITKVTGFTPQKIRVDTVYGNGLRNPSQVVLLEQAEQPE